MNPRMIIAIVLIVLGVLGLLYGGFNYTSRDRVVDTPIVKVDADRTHTVPIAPILGVVLLVGGAALLATGRRGP